MGGLPMRACISFAPARLTISIIRLDVVPRTMLSSIRTILWSFILSEIVFILRRTAVSRIAWPGRINVLPIYRFFISPSLYFILASYEYPMAEVIPESGTGDTISALTGCSRASSLPIFSRTL